MNIAVVVTVVMALSVAVAFYRSHREFRARERLYYSLCERIKSGERVNQSEYENLSPSDQAAIKRMMS